MRSIIIVLTTLAVFGASPAHSATLSGGRQNANLVPQYSKDLDFRFKRQSSPTTTTTTTTTTTPKPRKKRPSNIFGLISELVSETRSDTSRALNEIGTIFNSQFSENTPKPSKHTVSSTTPDPETDEDNEITTTTEPYRITRQEFFGILRSNVQGLMRLFQKELSAALRESSKNARQFGKDFRNAVMPYVT